MACIGDRVSKMAYRITSPTNRPRGPVNRRIQRASHEGVPQPQHGPRERTAQRRRRAHGRLKHLAGSEAIAGAFINDVRPEDAAERLRYANGHDR